MQEIDNCKGTYEMYEKEKKKKEILKKKVNRYKSDIQKADQENRDINIEKDQTIIQIKNSFMSNYSSVIFIRENGRIAKWGWKHEKKTEWKISFV